MHWQQSTRADPKARRVADRHYNRQTPGATQFVPPGRCLVLYADTGSTEAVWVTSWPNAQWVKHEWAGAWICSAFRNEGVAQSSTLIREAVAATRWHHRTTDTWRTRDEPDQGMITFIDASEVQSANPGYCYKCAGFEHVGYTQEQNLHALQLRPADMPDPAPPKGAQLEIGA